MIQDTPVWNNTNIYVNFDDPRIETDLIQIHKELSEITLTVSELKPLLNLNSSLNFNTTQSGFSHNNGSKNVEANKTHLAQSLQSVVRKSLDLQTLLFNLSRYAHLALSTDAKNQKASALNGKVTQLQSQKNEVMKPIMVYLQLCEDKFFQDFIKDPKVSELEFALTQDRNLRAHALSPDQEELLQAFAQDGYHAWGSLYTQLAARMQIEWDGQTIGLANVSSLLFQGDREIRKKAYEKIQAAWKQNETAAAAILNSIYGWRVQEYRKRSYQKPLHFLDQTCNSERIERTTLETLMNVTKRNQSKGQLALKLMAKEMGVNAIGPWDTLAPFPKKEIGSQKETSSKDAISFSDAMQVITDAFGEFDSELADFATMAWKKGWIDAKPTENRSTGAYCSGFVSPREPRVFQTFQGSMKDIVTLAHELGHAYHNWVMRDLPITHCHYTSGLAETASVFAETLVRNSLVRRAKTNEEKKKILWHEIEALTQFTINIPARYEFEKSFFEARAERPLLPSEMCALMDKAWKTWYGDQISETNSYFWAEKLHFAITRISFYNYPYLFGYLFSLGVYASRDQFGQNFKEVYVGLLRDTGRMRPVDLVKKHLGQNLNSSEFWQASFDVAAKSIEEYQRY